VLQLATADLLQKVAAELQQNETLEAAVRPAAEPPPVAPPRAAESFDDGVTPWRRGGGGDDEDGKSAFLANVPARPPSLPEHVRDQLAFRAAPPLLAEAVQLLVEHLDERGLLPFELVELAERLDVPLELLTEARALLATLEPRGLGAPDPVAAMLAQAQGDPDLPRMERLLREHLDELARNKLPDVARALAIPLDELRELLDRMRDLNPRPAAAFHDAAEPPLRADAYAWLHDGAVCVAVDDASLPDLQVSAEYAALARDRGTAPEVRAYLKPKLRSARDFIDAVAHRQATLLRVVDAVLRAQVAFLQKGATAIKPLRMADVAGQLGMHASTISRAIAGKSVQTDRGVFRLRDFFDGGRAEADGPDGEGQGRLAIAQRIAELVAAEDKARPLSDDELVERLAAAGIRCARRTVTKHRRQLGLPSSYLRRRYGDTP
jgi:RNA polymerase sigma-54 factor